MLTIVVEGEEYFDEATGEFSSVETSLLTLEHSLVSLSKWESKFQKPFLSEDEKTQEEILNYIMFMVVGPVQDPGVFSALSEKNFVEINDYIQSPESATTFGEMPKRPGRGEVITAELIYYWMVAYSIPFECETWHLNRLFALIKICNIKNNPDGNKGKKIPKREIAERNRALNDRRRKELGTRG